jgi:hypothetical protein
LPPFFRFSIPVLVSPLNSDLAFTMDVVAPTERLAMNLESRPKPLDVL